MKFQYQVFVFNVGIYFLPSPSQYASNTSLVIKPLSQESSSVVFLCLVVIFLGEENDVDPYFRMASRLSSSIF
jgi:hypothetical protein